MSALSFSVYFFPVIATADEMQGQDILNMSLEELLFLKVVKVTARKKIEDSQDIPVSLSVIKSQQLKIYSSAAKDIRLLNARTPSLVVESSFDRLFPRFYMRGLGNTDFDINASQPVSIVFDGIVQENSMLKGFPVFDFDRVEILRGPQGTLFGRNTPAGLIKFESNKPTSQFESYANLSFGSHQNIDFEGAVNGFLANDWTARFSLLKQKRNNWIDNRAPGVEQKDILGGFDELAARIQLNYVPNAKTDMLFNFHFRDFEANPAVFRANILTAGSNSLNADFEHNQVFLDAADRTYQKLNSQGASFTFKYQYVDHEITAISGYESVDVFSRGDVDGGFGAAFLPVSGPGNILFPAENASSIPKHIQLTQELRIASKDKSRVDYQLGLFYFYEDVSIDSLSFNTFEQGVQNGLSTQNQKTNAWAIFGSVDYEVVEDLTLNLGIRFSSDNKAYKTSRIMSPIGAGELTPIEINKGDDHISWNVGGVYKITNEVHFFARIAETFRAPSIQGRLIFSDLVTTADSETVLSVETGIKSDILGGRGRVNLSLYRFIMQDQQITAVGGDTNTNRLINVDETKGYGIELDSEFIFNENWSWSANMSYNNTQINDQSISVSVCSQCTVTDPLNSDGFAIIDGNNLPHAPALIYNLSATFETAIAGGDFYMTTDWSYRSKIDFFLYHSEEFVGQSLLEGGLRAAYRWHDNKVEYEAALFIRNMTNQHVLIGGVDFNNLTGIVNEPRFIGFEIKASL